MSSNSCNVKRAYRCDGVVSRLAASEVGHEIDGIEPSIDSFGREAAGGLARKSLDWTYLIR